MLIKLYYIIIILYLLCLLFRVAGLKKFVYAVGITALIANGAALVLIFLTNGQFPGFNTFEAFLYISFILGLLGISLKGVREYSEKIRLWVWLEILLLLFITLFFAKEPTPSAYNHNYIFIILFQAFRHTSLALMLYSSAYYIQYIIQREKDERTRLLSQQGRNFLVLSAVLFFMSEYVGIIWCQKGWGDFWMWSQGFFQSTFIVLFLMLVFHIPGKGKFAEDIKSITGGLTGFVVLILSIIRSFL